MNIIKIIVAFLVFLTCGLFFLVAFTSEEPMHKKVVILVPVAILVTLVSFLFAKDKIKFLSWFIKLIFPKNTIPDLKEMSGCHANAPNLPNPSRPWCSICTVHSDFNLEITYTGADGSTKKELYYCRDCKTEMHIPSVAKFAGKSLGQIWLRICLFIFLPVGLFGFGVESLKNESSLDGEALIFLLFGVGGGYCIMLIIMRRYIKIYRKWEKWAKENCY